MPNLPCICNTISVIPSMVFKLWSVHVTLGLDIEVRYQASSEKFPGKRKFKYAFNVTTPTMGNKSAIGKAKYQHFSLHRVILKYKNFPLYRLVLKYQYFSVNREILKYLIKMKEQIRHIRGRNKITESFNEYISTNFSRPCCRWNGMTSCEVLVWQPSYISKQHLSRSLTQSVFDNMCVVAGWIICIYFQHFL